MLRRSFPGVNLAHIYTRRHRVLAREHHECSSSFPVGRSHVPGCHQKSPTCGLGAPSPARQRHGVCSQDQQPAQAFLLARVMQTCNLRAVIDCIKSNPESLIFFCTALVGNIKKKTWVSYLLCTTDSCSNHRKGLCPNVSG